MLQTVRFVSCMMMQLDAGTLWKWHINHIYQYVTRPDHDTPVNAIANEATHSSPFIAYPLPVTYITYMWNRVIQNKHLQ